MTTDREPTSTDESHDDAREQPSLWQPRRLIAQIAGFLIGGALLAWCIHNALKAGNWSALLETNPLLIAGLAACSLVSLLVNGAGFWLMIKPVQPLRFVDLQMVNLTTALLNYAPIRLGFISRVLYHLRVDRMPLLRFGGWMAATAYILFFCLGAVVVATLVRPNFDALWFALLAGQLIVGGLFTRGLLGQPIVQRHARGMEQMLLNHPQLWGVIALRLIDIGAFAGRMGFAVMIVPDLTLSATDTVLLAMTALALSMNPLGRFGFREAGVAFLAERLVSSDMTTGELTSRMAQLGLIESAGEAIVFIPLGTLALFWYRARWKNAAAAASSSRTTDA